MRSSIPALSIMLFISACQKDDPSPGGATGGGTGGPGTGGGLISSWSPQKPYVDESITFVGGPFPTAPNAITITSNGLPLEIIGNTGTELVVQAPAGTENDMVVWYSTVVIATATDTAEIYPFHWKKRMDVTFFADNLDEIFNGQPARAGDSLRFNGSGFTTSGMTVSINGQPITTPVGVDSSFWCNMRFRVPLSLASGNDESVVTPALLTATNADGRTDTLTFAFAPTPRMDLYEIILVGGGYTFDISDMSSGAQVLNFEVRGRHLRSDVNWSLQGPSPASGTLGVGGYPNTAALTVDPASMAPGTYTLSVGGFFGVHIGFALVP